MPTALLVMAFQLTFQSMQYNIRSRARVHSRGQGMPGMPLHVAARYAAHSGPKKRAR